MRADTVRSTPPEAVIDLWEGPTGEWRWRYREASNHTRLLSNENYVSREDAEQAARRSYHGVPIVERSPKVEPGSAWFWLLLAGGGALLVFVVLALLGLGALVMIAAGWRELRRRFSGSIRPWAVDVDRIEANLQR
jgi:hypothetical protein